MARCATKSPPSLALNPQPTGISAKQKWITIPIVYMWSGWLLVCVALCIPRTSYRFRYERMTERWEGKGRGCKCVSRLTNGEQMVCGLVLLGAAHALRQAAGTEVNQASMGPSRGTPTPPTNPHPLHSCRQAEKA